MKKVKFIEDFEFNVHGGAGGRVYKQAGELWEGPDWLCDKLVNHWEVASYHGVGPSETKAPSMDWLKDELIAYAESKGVDVGSGDTKAEILEKINA